MERLETADSLWKRVVEIKQELDQRNRRIEELEGIIKDSVNAICSNLHMNDEDLRYHKACIASARGSIDTVRFELEYVRKAHAQALKDYEDRSTGAVT